MKKRKQPHTNSLKMSILAVPAAALMLGAAQAGTTVGLNFQAWYYDSGAVPQTVGYGKGYQTTGFPVTAKAFGVEVADWTSTDPLDCQAEISTSVSFGGTLTANLTAPNAWQSGIGEQVPGWEPQTVAPGDDEVTWGYLDDGNSTGKSPQVSVSGLKAKFPDGYVLQAIASNSGSSFNDVDITDEVTTNTVVYSTYHLANMPLAPDKGGTVGLTAQSGVFTNDTIEINPQPKTADKRSVLAGFIITDKPVVSKKPASMTLNQGAQLVLSAGVIGISPMGYQWKHAGTNVPGATTVPFSKTATAEDAGNWVLVATNAYGTGTSVESTVTINQAPLITKDLVAETNLVYVGFKSLLSVTAGGAEPLVYQWMKNGTALPGATNAAYTAENLTPGLSGYSVVVTNQYGLANSDTNHLQVIAVPDAYTAQVAQDGPLSFYPMGETTGMVTYDYAGLAHNGAISNSVTMGSAGPRPPAFPGFNAGTTAYEFDGFGSYVDCGTGPALSGTTDFTLEAWVNTLSQVTARLIQQRSGYLGEYMFDIKDDGTVNFTVYGTGGYQFQFPTTTVVNDGNWHQIAAVRSGTNGYIYIDGSLAAEASGPQQALDPTFTVGFGKDIRDGSSFYGGKLGQVAIYDKALTSGRIASHYATAIGALVSIQVTPGGLVEISWPSGTLESSPSLGASANWTAVGGATPPKYSFTPTGTALYFRSVQ